MLDQSNCAAWFKLVQKNDHAKEAMIKRQGKWKRPKPQQEHGHVFVGLMWNQLWKCKTALFHHGGQRNKLIKPKCGVEQNYIIVPKLPVCKKTFKAAWWNVQVRLHSSSAHGKIVIESLRSRCTIILPRFLVRNLRSCCNDSSSESLVWRFLS